MSELVLKFEMLEPRERQLLLEFLEFLLTKQRKSQSQKPENYREKLLKVSVWSDDDIKDLKQATNQLNKWQAPTW